MAAAENPFSLMLLTPSVENVGRPGISWTVESATTAIRTNPSTDL